MKHSIQVDIPVFMIYLVLGVKFAFLLHFAAGCINNCVETVIYTVPAIETNAADTSAFAYIRQTGLFRHLQRMPESAKWSFAWHSIELILLMAIDAFIVVAGIRLHRKVMEG